MLDITIDFETCALCPTAAVMSVGAVAWLRDGEETPFLCLPDTSNEMDADFVFSAHVDLRGMFLDGFTFDDATAKWWADKSDSAKLAVLDSDGEGMPCSPIKDVVKSFCLWVEDLKRVTEDNDVYLWSQGTDFDIAILRNICHKYGINLPVNYKNFRDHRTYFLEAAHTICDIAEVKFDPSSAYLLVEDLPEQGAVHDPVFDCKRSIYSTWQMMNHLHCFRKDAARNIVNSMKK